METIKSIDKQIADKRKQLENAKGSECEVYTRIVGYYRSTKNFNNGQDAQRRQRKVYNINEGNGESKG
jgi:ribonucleoside-triphosphate reductase